VSNKTVIRYMLFLGSRSWTSWDKWTYFTLFHPSIIYVSCVKWRTFFYFVESIVRTL